MINKHRLFFVTKNEELYEQAEAMKELGLEVYNYLPEAELVAKDSKVYYVTCSDPDYSFKGNWDKEIFKRTTAEVDRELFKDNMLEAGNTVFLIMKGREGNSTDTLIATAFQALSMSMDVSKGRIYIF